MNIGRFEKIVEIEPLQLPEPLRAPQQVPAPAESPVEAPELAPVEK